MDNNKPDHKMNGKLKKQQGLDKELIAKSHKAMKASKGITTTDLFVFGAVKRILSNSDAFQNLIVQRNFSTCAALLRMQIDTAMRLNAMTLMDDLDSDIKSVLFGEKQFNRLKDKNGNTLKDFYLVQKLSEKEPWVKEVYSQTSDFVHLSGRLFMNTIHELKDDGTMILQISAEDPFRNENDYDEIIASFYHASKVASTLVLGYLIAYHSKKPAKTL